MSVCVLKTEDAQIQTHSWTAHFYLLYLILFFTFYSPANWLREF